MIVELEPNLGGRTVQVVEDDYYLATDSVRALRSAGADIIGPNPNEEAARDAMRDRRPDAVVLDINLGAGATFSFASHLKTTGVPFLFVTGYDQEIIPEEFGDVVRLQKPIQLRTLVGAVAKLLNANA